MPCWWSAVNIQLAPYVGTASSDADRAATAAPRAGTHGQPPVGVGPTQVAGPAGFPRRSLVGDRPETRRDVSSTACCCAVMCAAATSGSRQFGGGNSWPSEAGVSPTPPVVPLPGVGVVFATSRSRVGSCTSACGPGVRIADGWSSPGQAAAARFLWRRSWSGHLTSYAQPSRSNPLMNQALTSTWPLSTPWRAQVGSAWWRL